MGAWGPALFSDDLTCDVRDHYRELVEDGVADEDAQRHVLESYAEVLDDPDEGHLVWLALAVTQSKIGRLDTTVRDRALAVIERGEGLSLWTDEGAKVLADRQAALRKVQAQLTGPQPERRRLRRPWRHVTDLTPGTVLAYRVPSGKVVLLRVARIDDHRTARAPVLALMNHLGDAIPSGRELDALADAVDRSCPLGVPVDSPLKMTIFRVAAYRKKDPDHRDLGFERLAEPTRSRPRDEALEPEAYTGWEGLVETMERFAGCR